MSAAPKQNSHEQYASLISEPLRKDFKWDGISIFDHSEPQVVIEEALAGQTQHIVQSAHPHFVQDLNVSARMMQDCEALVRQPLATILAPDKGDAVGEKQFLFFERAFSEAGQKSEILSNVDSELSKRSISDSIRGDVLLIADELFTNAIYNAPFVDLENTASGAPRDSENIKMPSNKAGHLVLGGDSQRIVIGCRDEFGSLNFEKLLTRIKNCYEGGVAGTMRMSGRGGAGIGSYMIFKSAATIFFDVKVNRHTAVYCTLPTKMSSRARTEMPKNMHFLIEKK